MTHNLLMCNKKGCTINNFPLKLVGTKTEIQPQEFNNDLIERFLRKIDLKALTSVTKDVIIILLTLFQLNQWKFNFEELKEEEFKNKDILTYIHHILLEIVVIEGKLVCNGCNREYEIKNGIPNMIYNDDEI